MHGQRPNKVRCKKCLVSVFSSVPWPARTSPVPLVCIPLPIGMGSSRNRQSPSHDAPSRSFTSSYVKNDVAILGATLTIAESIADQLRSPKVIQSDTLRRLGHNPRYSPFTPSVRTMLNIASIAPLYLTPNAFIPVTCIFRRRTSNGYVNVCDIDPASAPHSNFRGILLFPGGVITPRSASYAAKLIPAVQRENSQSKINDI